jgi:8-oxo-dGTP diphosphatase
MERKEIQKMKSDIPVNTNYVVGFIFSPDFKSVLLVEKKKPKWQVGLLNGVGGKIEIGEGELDAMIRECKEETGLWIAVWQRAAVMTNPFTKVHFFFATHEFIGIPAVNDVDERLFIVQVDMIAYLRTISNLQYLIPLCVHFESSHGGTKICKPVQIEEGQ